LTDGKRIIENIYWKVIKIIIRIIKKIVVIKTTSNRCPECGGKLKDKEFKWTVPQQDRTRIASNAPKTCKKCGKSFVRRRRTWIRY
jgi:uncharacterized protein with PIN domain